MLNLPKKINMNDNINNNSGLNALSLFSFLWKWRRLILILTISAAIVSAGATYLITPKYKSKVILFPTSTNSISKALISENSDNKSDILEIGKEEQGEQLLQILNSNKIRDEIINRFNLMKHYDIDENSKYKYTKLIKEYEQNITFKRTEFMAVEISVLDKDPQMAADIANAISDILDSTKNLIQKERAQKGFEIVKNTYETLVKEIDLLSDSLRKIREKGVHDYETQSEMINQELAIQIGKGNDKGVARLKAQLDTLAKYGGTYVTIRNLLTYKIGQLAGIKAKYEEARVDAQEYFPQKFVVDRAYKAEKKSTPVRWLIVVISTFSAFLLTIFSLIFYENVYTNLKTKASN
jgi:capsular polysaccharide biosynthesis protein